MTASSRKADSTNSDPDTADDMESYEVSTLVR